MNLNTVTEVRRPTSADEIPEWREGYAWLAGGTWLFSTPQIATHTLIDLELLRWPALKLTPDGLEIAATCTIAELEQFQAPANWTAAPLLKLCCHALLMSFKIYNAATVGGNICMSLPAGAMISLMAVAGRRLHAVAARAASRARCPRSISSPATTRTCSSRASCCAASIFPPARSRKRFAFRRNSLTHLGRSAALLVGTQTKGSDDFLLTITAATPSRCSCISIACRRPVRLHHAIDAAIHDGDWFDDVHGSAPYKRHLTYYYAEQIRAELAAK